MTRLSGEDAVGFGCIGLALLFHVAFWGAVVYVAYHFIAKYW